MHNASLRHGFAAAGERSMTGFPRRCASAAFELRIRLDKRTLEQKPLLRQGLPRSARHGPLSAAASRRRKKPEGARAGSACVRCLYMDVQSANLRSLLAQSRGHGCPRDRGREGALFFGDFLLGKQKKVTRPPGRRTEKHTDVCRLSRNRHSSKDKSQSWIPAFARMTRRNQNPTDQSASNSTCPAVELFSARYVGVIRRYGDDA